MSKKSPTQFPRLSYLIKFLFIFTTADKKKNIFSTATIAMKSDM